MSIYQQFWGLSRSPFENSVDPEFFFRSDTHQAALLKMRYVIDNRQGGGLFVGGIGFGKTHLARLFEQDPPAGVGPLVHVLFPQLSSSELLAYIAVELGAEESDVGCGGENLDRTIRQLQQQFRHYTADGKHPVIIIDDAHLIDDPRVFRTLGLLLNFSHRPDIDFSLLLLGEPLLLGPIGRIAQLSERLGVRSVLQPLGREETFQYVHHRLEVAGHTGSIFEDDALTAVFELSGGVPRRINRLCDLALLVGYADELHSISAAEVEAVGAELATAVAD